MGIVSQHPLSVSDERRHRGAVADSASPDTTSLSTRSPLTGASRRHVPVTGDVQDGSFGRRCLAPGSPVGFLPFSSGGPSSPPAFAAPPRSPREPDMARPGCLFPKAPEAARRLVSRPPIGRFMLVLLNPRPARLRVGRGPLFYRQALRADPAWTAFFDRSRPPLDVIPILEAPRSFER